MSSKDSPDTSAADKESALLQKQYDENQKQEGEQRDELDKEEMAFIKSDGNLQYLPSPDGSTTDTRLLTNPNSTSLTDEVNNFSSLGGESVAMESINV